MAAYSGGILDWSLTRSWRYRLPTDAARGDGAMAPGPDWAPMKRLRCKKAKGEIGRVRAPVWRGAAFSLIVVVVYTILLSLMAQADLVCGGWM